MKVLAILSAAGAAAMLVGVAPAMAQPDSYNEPVPFYAAVPYDAAVPVIDELVPFLDGGHYSARREAYIGPDGAAQTRCRPHRACYNVGPSDD